MKKVLLSVSLIIAVGAIVAGATGAFFSDTETSTGNTFTAGAIDLGIDNVSYYNGVANSGTSWNLTFDLEDGNGNNATGTYLFFDFNDIKPGDFGEDTISIHITNNESWLCADVTLTSDNDNSCTEPENDSDAENGNCIVGPGNGDLAQYIDFLWWADDGDNVLESDENVLVPTGNLGQLGVGNTATVDLADANSSIWGTSHPFINPDNSILTDEAEEILYIGKAWCFGDITADALTPGSYSGPDDAANDGQDTGGPATPEDGGFNCSGSIAGNEAQTDSVTLNVSFRAEQARNNSSFECEIPT